MLAAVISISSYAQDAKNVKDSAKSLQEAIVTANNIPQKQNETGKVLTVISRQELKEFG